MIWLRCAAAAAAVLLGTALVPSESAAAQASASDQPTVDEAQINDDAGNPAVEVSRLSGSDRYETSLVVAREFTREMGGYVEAVVLASGSSWQDASIAASLAGGVDLPMLLVPSGGLGPSARSMLADSGIRRAIVVGTHSSIPNQDVESLRRLGIRIERIGETEAVERALAAAGLVGFDESDDRSAGAPDTDVADGGPDTVGGLARSRGPARAIVLLQAGAPEDAAVAAVTASRAQIPLLLTSTESLSPQTAQFLTAHDVTHAIVVGPASALDVQLRREIESRGTAVVGLGGWDAVGAATAAAEFSADDSTGRFEMIARRDCVIDAPQMIGVSTVHAPWDALSAASLLGRRCAPMLLTDRGGLSAEANAALYRARHTGGIDALIIGGEAAVGPGVVAQVHAPELPVRAALVHADEGSAEQGRQASRTILIVDERGRSREYLRGSSVSAIERLVWSPQLRHLAIAGVVDGVAGLFVLELASDELTRLTPRNQDHRVRYWPRPAWSPDGSRIAVTVHIGDFDDAYEHVGTEVLIADIRTGKSRRLTSNAEMDEHGAWSPDGTRLLLRSAVLSRFTRSANFDAERLVALDVETDTVVEFTHRGFVLDALWSPDGSRLAIGTYHAMYDDGYQRPWIQITPADGSTAGIVTNEDAEGVLFDWSPDGEHFAFSRSSYYSDQLSLMNAADGSLTYVFDDQRWTSYPNPASPSYRGWSPDSKRIVTVSGGHDQNVGYWVSGMASFDVHDGPATSLPLAHDDSKLRYGGFSPEGTHIVYASTDVTDLESLIAVTDARLGTATDKVLDVTAFKTKLRIGEVNDFYFEWPQLGWSEYGIHAVGTTTEVFWYRDSE